jgi:hypothetical protein
VAAYNAKPNVAAAAAKLARLAEKADAPAVGVQPALAPREKPRA